MFDSWIDTTSGTDPRSVPSPTSPLLAAHSAGQRSKRRSEQAISCMPPSVRHVIATTTYIVLRSSIMASVLGARTRMSAVPTRQARRHRILTARNRPFLSIPAGRRIRSGSGSVILQALQPRKQKPRKSGDLRGFAAIAGGDGGIRTLDPGFGPDAPLAGECLRPLGHVSQTFARAGSQRDEAKIIAGSQNQVNF